jgi:hypothetical protein
MHPYAERVRMRGFLIRRDERRRHTMTRIMRRALTCVVVGLFCLTLMVSGAPATDTPTKGSPLDTALVGGLRTDVVSAVDGPSDFTIYFRPAVRFGTDNRTLYIMDFLVPFYQGEKNIVFFNPKFTPNDLDGWETNLGVGYRHLLFDDRLVLGANVFYDTRRTGWGTYWDQVGFGLEAMGEVNKYVALTGRFNYYIPLTDPIASEGGLGGGYIFRDQGIYSLGGSVEEALEGFDAELGFRVPYLSDYVETWVYGGGYHYGGKYIKDVDGYSLRLELIPTDFVRLNYEYREDRTNMGEHHGEVAVEVPFSIGNLIAGKNPFEGFGKRLSGSRTLKERMVEPVRRDVDITVKIEEGAGVGAGGLVDEVVFVSEGGEADPLADGTFEHPWGSFTEALADPRIVSGAAFTIHVINDNLGDMVVPGRDINVAYLLLWGSGCPHPRYGVISNMMAGAPTISSANGIGLTGNDMEACGLYFENIPGDDGIGVYGDRAYVHHNSFFNTWRGVDVDGGNDAVVAYNTMLTGTHGVLVDSGASGTRIFGNTIDDFDDGVEVLNGSTNLTITGNFFGTTTSVVNGVDLQDIPGPVFIGSNYINASGRGITSNSACSGSITVAGNPFISPEVRLEGFDDVTFTTNTLTSSTGDGLYLNAPTSGHLDALVSGNTITVTGGSVRSVQLRSFNGAGTMNATITGNNISAVASGVNASNGIWVDTWGDVTVNITGNDIVASNTTSNTNGIRVNSDGGDVNATVANNNITATVAGLLWGATGVELKSTGVFRVFGTLSGNYGHVDSTPNTYMFSFDTGNPGALNSVDWSGNGVFTTGASGWDGNYDAGSGLPGPLTNGRIFTNFIVGDTLTP